MTRHNTCSLYVILCILCLSELSLHAQFAGPFTPRSGGGFLSGIFQYQSYSSLQVMNDTMNRSSLLRPVSRMAFRFNAEYGPIDKLTIFIMLPIHIVSTNNYEYNPESNFTDTLKRGSLTGLGNLEAGVKYKFYHKKWVMAVSLFGEMKTGTFDNPTGLRTANDAWGIVPMFHIGRSWKERYYFFSDIGGCYRTDGYSGDWRIQAEGGAKFFNMLWIRAAIQSRRSFYNGRFENMNNLQTGLYLNDQEWLSLNACVEYQHKIGFGVQAGITGYFLGNNIPKSPVFYGGIFYKWNYDYAEDASYRIEKATRQ